MVNVLTQKDFEGFLLRSDHQITESHKQNDNKVGFLYGFKNDKNKLVLGLESFIGLRYLRDKLMESPIYQSVHLERLLLPQKMKRFHLDLIKVPSKKEKNP